MFIENVDIFYTELGNRIKSARKVVGMNQEDLAYQLGLKRASIANIESGKQRPPVHIIILMAKILQLEFSYLFSSPRVEENIQTKASENKINITWDNAVTTVAIKSTTKKDIANLLRNNDL